MRRYLPQLYAAVFLLASAAAQSAVINHPAATITYNDDEAFGSLSADFESSFSGITDGGLDFNSVADVDASSSGQNSNATSFIWLTIKAAPGYVLTLAGFNETGSWVTGNSGSVDIAAHGSIVNTATGTPLSLTPITISKDTEISGSSLAAGTWSVSNNFFTDPTLAPTEITVAIARTLSASTGSFPFSSALIGNTHFGFGNGTGLHFFYNAQLIPEPATYLMSALGLVVLIAMRLRRQ